MPRKTAPSVSASLFAEPESLKPLAERMRPREIGEIVGQTRLVAPGRPLRRAVESGHVHSMILWGPPGCGKTTLALLLARYADAQFRAISAVLSGLADAHATPGGLNEQLARDLTEAGVYDAVRTGLDRILARIAPN